MKKNRFVNLFSWILLSGIFALSPISFWAQEEATDQEDLNLEQEEPAQDLEQEEPVQDVGEKSEQVNAENIKNDENDENIAEILVTSDRIQQKSREMTDAHTVISRKDIENSGKQTIMDVLANQAGIDMRNYGGFGRQTSIYIRGNASGGTLFLIDGFEASTLQVQNLPMDSIERVEVLRGNQTALYGDKAYGGVINIILRKDQTTQKETIVLSHALLGSHWMHDLGVGLKTNAPDYNVFVYAGYLDTKGYTKVGDYEIPRAGAKIRSLTFSSTFRPSQTSKLELSGNFMDSMHQRYTPKYATPKKLDTRSENSDGILQAAYSHLLFDFFEPKLTFRYNLSHSGWGTMYDGFNFNFQNNFYFADSKNITALGFQYKYDQIGKRPYGVNLTYKKDKAGEFTLDSKGKKIIQRASTKSRYSDSTNSKIFYLSNNFKLIPNLFINGTISYELWARGDGKDIENDKDGKKSNESFRWQAGIAYNIIDDVNSNLSLIKARSNGGGGKIFPRSQSGNKLKPTKNISFDAGLDLYFFKDLIRLGGTFFYTVTQNFISWIQIDRTQVSWQSGSHANVGDYSSNGFEVELKSSLPMGFSINGAYTRTKLKKLNTGKDKLNFARDLSQKEKDIVAKLKSNPSDTIDISRRSKDKMRVDLNWDGTKPLNFPLHFNFSWLFVGERESKDWSYNRRDGEKGKNPTYGQFLKSPSYSVFDIGTSYTLLKSITFIFQVNNLFNKEYQPILDYPEDGRNFYGGLKLHLQI